MKKDWFINEIILKLALINIKLKSSTSKSGESPTRTEDVAAYLGTQGVKVALKAFNGPFVTAALNMSGELIANRSKMDAREIICGAAET